MINMTQRQIIKKVQKVVKAKLWGESTGHDYWHAYRVARIAKFIAKKEKANLQVLELAGWLHDIALPQGRKAHEIKSAQFAKKFLSKLEVNEEIINQVANCIKKHRFSKKRKAKVLEERILQDADKLDILGAMGIARTFIFAGKYRQIIHDPKVKPDLNYYFKHGESKTTINHFYDKLFRLKDLFHTQTAKKLAKQREKYMKNYLKRFYLEWEGKK